MKNEYSIEQFRAQLASGAFAWPGGYPLFFITSDSAALSFDAAKAEAEAIEDSIASKADDGWRVVACEVNWEDASLFCDHSGKRIESAYAEDEAKL